MNFSFKTILIPVDFSINSEVAISKALELAKTDANFHLLHVVNDLADMNIAKAEAMASGKFIDPAEANNMLNQWKDCIKDVLPSAQVCTWISASPSIQNAISKKAKEIGADLIVIGKNSNHTWLPFLNTVLPVEIAEAANAAVLTVKPGSLHNKIKTVVVPVTDEMPQHKMEVIAMLCKKDRIKVYLVTFINGSQMQEQFSASPLLKTYQWLKSVLHCQVEYSVLHGYNKAKAVLAYAEKTGADILLLNPKSETKIGWPNRHISDALPSQSKVQVLTVQPY